MLEPIAEWSGLDLVWIKVFFGIFVFLFLRWGWRNPWGLMRVVIIVTLLSGAAYAAFQLSKTGLSGKKSMYSEQDQR